MALRVDGSPALNRRDSVLALLAATIAGHALPIRAQAQVGHRPYVIALLPDFREGDPALKLLTDLLGEAGRLEGRDFVYLRSGVFYGGDIQSAIDRAMAGKPDLILATNLGFAIAAHQWTKTLPIVMWVSGFPIEGGVADSLARPGKNVTGMTIYAGGRVLRQAGSAGARGEA